MEESIPLIEVREDAEQGTFGAALPTSLLPEVKNYADSESLRKQIQQDIYPITTWTRSNRVPLEDEWKCIRRMEMMRHDEGQKYRGRSNAYLPIYHRVLSTIVSSLSKGLFPSDEYLDVVDRSGMKDPARSKSVKTYLQWEFEKNGRVRNNIKPFLRQYVSYGNSVLKYWYRKKLETQGRLNVTMGGVMPSFKPAYTSEGLAVSTRSMFSTYVYPPTAESMDDATVVFEDIEVTRKYIELMKSQGRWYEADKVFEAPVEANWNSNQADLLNDAAGLSTSSNALGDMRLGETRMVTEIWTYLRLPKSAYLPHENIKEDLPVRIVMAGDHVLEVTRNPFWHQRPPYLFGRQNTHPGLFYGSGFGRLVRPLQYLANDFANQTNDCGNYVLNPINKVNPAHMVGPLRPLAPGVTWYMTNLEEGQKFDRPPPDLIQLGQSQVSMYVGMGMDLGGAPPVLQGTGGGKAAKTATGSQILQRNAMVPLQDLVEDIELDVMVPLMFGTWMNAQQYRTEEVMIEVAGENLKIDPSMLVIDPEFRWLASNQAANQQMRAQQAISLMQAAGPLTPLLQQQGYVVDFAPLIKRVYADGFGFRGFDQFIYKAQMQPGMPPGAPGSMPSMPSGAEGQATPSEPDRIRSALEQIAGGGGEMEAGEGEDFMAIRAQADELAGQEGGNNG